MLTDPRNHTAVDPDFSPQIVADLYRYRPRRLWLTIFLAVFAGLFGAHRFYCGKPLTGAIMLLTLGGGFIWWIRDLFYLRRMVLDCDAEALQRQQAGLPPRGMGFLPPQDQLRLDAPPAWAKRRAGRGRVIGSVVLLSLIGLSLGLVSGSLQMYEPTIVLVLFIAVSLTAARWPGMARLPILNALTRWVHRLRLYYHTVDPGHGLRLAMRPLIGVFLAPWRPKARAEVSLYLQNGAIDAMLNSAMDTAELIASGGFWAGVGILLAEFAQMFFFIYLFVAPAGALLTTQLLLSRRDSVVWGLSALTLATLYLGMSMVAS